MTHRSAKRSHAAFGAAQHQPAPPLSARRSAGHEEHLQNDLLGGRLAGRRQHRNVPVVRGQVDDGHGARAQQPLREVLQGWGVTRGSRRLGIGEGAEGVLLPAGAFFGKWGRVLCILSPPLCIQWWLRKAGGAG